MSPDSSPFELPGPGGRAPDFQEYALLILSELRRLTEGQAEMQRSIQELLRSNGLLTQRMDDLSRNWDKEFKRHVEDFERYQTEVAAKFKEHAEILQNRTARVETLEIKDERSLATLSGKKWVVGIVFIVLTAIVLPLINLYQSFQGS